MPPEDDPAILAPYGLSAPTSWFVHLVVFEGGHPVLHGPLVTFRRLVPRFRVLRRDPVGGFPRPALPRFLAPSALPFRQEPPLPDVPARVMLRPRAYHAPRRLAPSAISLVSFQPGALTGFAPKSSGFSTGSPSVLALGQTLWACFPAARVSKSLGVGWPGLLVQTNRARRGIDPRPLVAGVRPGSRAKSEAKRS